jgi:hypothetical protein
MRITHLIVDGERCKVVCVNSFGWLLQSPTGERFYYDEQDPTAYRAARVPDDPYGPERDWRCPCCGKVPADGTIIEQVEGGKVMLAYRLCRECEDPNYCMDCGLTKQDDGSGDRKCPQCELGWIG